MAVGVGEGFEGDEALAGFFAVKGGRTTASTDSLVTLCQNVPVTVLIVNPYDMFIDISCGHFPCNLTFTAFLDLTQRRTSIRLWDF